MNWWVIIWLVLPYMVGFVTYLGYEVSRKALAACRRRSGGLDRPNKEGK